MHNAATMELVFPVEIFVLILKSLHKSLSTRDFLPTISRCCRVSKLFNEMCSPQFFCNGVQFGPTGSDRRRIPHSRAIRLLKSLPSSDVYVQHIAYNFDFRQPKEADKRDLPWPPSSIFKQLPNVRSISIRCDGRHSLSQNTGYDDEREIFPQDPRGYRLLLENNTSVQTVTTLTFGHIRRIPCDILLSLPNLKDLSLHFCSLLDLPVRSLDLPQSRLTAFAATYTDFNPSFLGCCPNLEKIDVQGANPNSTKLSEPLTTSTILHDFSYLKEVSTDCSLHWASFLPPDPCPMLLPMLKKLHVQLDDDGAVELISGLLDKIALLEHLSLDMNLVRDASIDISKQVKAWRESLKTITFDWYKNKEVQLKILCDALDESRGSNSRQPFALRTLDLRTTIDLVNPDNIFDHDVAEWRRLDDILLSNPTHYTHLHSINININVTRICRDIRKEFTSDTANKWVARYVDDWLEQVPMKNTLDSTRVKLNTHVSSFALIFPGRDGGE